MKTGTIIYVVGEEMVGFDMLKAIKDLQIKADRVEIISSRSGHFDVMDAWWSLTAKGMQRIVCVLAEIVNDTGLKLTGREMQLCG